MGKSCVLSILRWLRLPGFAILVAVMILPVFARDLDGRYKGSPLHDWFDHLASGKGLCCSFADGTSSRMLIGIPGTAIMACACHGSQTPTTRFGSMCRMRPSSRNQTGQEYTVVWPFYGQEAVSIRCLMLGSMT